MLHHMATILVCYGGTTLSDDLFLCQVSKGSTVRFPRNVLDKIDAEEKSVIIRIIIII
jgi:hypothetical protein